MGVVRLTVSDLDRSRAFYEQTLGLSSFEREDGSLLLGAAGGRALVELTGNPSAPGRDPFATGLFHLAILMPSRHDLAHALGRLIRTRWPIDGASDHLVSEALYLSDPDGNGIEIYRDRPRAQWPVQAGKLQMATLPLDLRALAGELDGADSAAAVPPATSIGHVHLQVGDLGAAEQFYAGVLGFEVTVRGYPGALFVSAGGYHHHIGLNTWQSRGAGPPPSGSVGLRSYEVALPDREELERVRARIQASGMTLGSSDAGSLVKDPAGNALILGLASPS